MIEIRLDGQTLDVAENTSIGLTLHIDDIADPTSAKSSFSQSIDLPKTPRNVQVFLGCEEVLSPDIFNHSEHTASIFEDGIELISGKAYYEGASEEYYTLQIVGNEFEWLERIRDKKLNEIDEEKVSQFTRYAIADDDERRRIFFALVNHGCWWQEGEEQTVLRKWATYADLIPFVSLSTILDSIFKGYELIFTGWNPDLKYITGEWRKAENADVIAEDNTFEVKCTGNNISTIDEESLLSGVGVTISDDSPEAQYCEPFDTVEEDENGCISVEEKNVSYIYGEFDGEELVGKTETATHRNLTFTPTEDLTTSFVMRLKYASDFLIKNNDVIFADTVYFNGEKVAQFSIKDSTTFAEMNAGAPLNDEKFMKAVFPETLPPIEQGGEISAEDMQAFYLELSNPELYEAVVQVSVYTTREDGHRIARYRDDQVISTNIASKMLFRAACTFDREGDIIFNLGTNSRDEFKTRATIGLRTRNGNVVVIGDNERAFQRWQIEWVSRGDLSNEVARIRYVQTRDADLSALKTATVKLYKFSDSEQITIDTTLLTTAYSIAGETPLSVGFGCSKSSKLEAGTDKLAVIVAEDSSLSTKFNNVLPYGYQVSLNDVGGEALATNVLKSIMQLYNLRIYTNPDDKKVYIAPHYAFYRNDVVDWRNRIDIDKGVSVSDIGSEIGNKVQLRYQATNPAIEYYNNRHTKPYASYEQPLKSVATKQTKVVENPVFNAPMLVPQRDIFEEGVDNMLTFATATTRNTIADIDYDLPRTVVLIAESGVSADPTDWLTYVPTTGILAEYEQPLMRIADPDMGDTLDFDDRNDVGGLYYNYSQTFDTWNYGKRIRCYCRVLPQEIESLRKAGTSVVDFRSRFLLHINGEDIYCRLESIENYEPQNATHKCTFIY